MSQPLPISTLNFRGANLEALRDKTHELILSAPADTGKTYALCYKSIVIAMNVAKCHGAIVRQTYNSMQDSVVKTFDRVAQGLGIQKLGGSRADKYVFKNGSEIVLIGMDNANKLFSSEWDFIQVCQAEELKVGDWETAASRVTGRGAVFKHPQIFGDCNPSFSKHWIRSRKQLKFIVGSVKDNPELYQDDGSLTPEGARRMELADSMYTGVRRQRLLLGIWATAEGAVYDTFMPQTHVCVRPLSEMKTFMLTLDEGYTNPAVILVIGEDGDGRWHCFREFYQTQQLQETVVKTTKQWYDEFHAEEAAVDEAAPALIADLINCGVHARGAKGRVEGGTNKHIILDGIQAVQNRLQVQGDGRPRYTIDPSCVNHINEFESYVWKPEKDEPEKQYDHTMDALRYLVCMKAMPTGAFSAGQIYSGTGRGENLGLEHERLVFDNERITL